MRRAGLSLTLALSAFAAAENVVSTSVLSATALEGKAADVKTAAQNILIKTEGAVPSGAKIGSDDKPLAFKVANIAGEDAVVLVVSNLEVAAAKLDEAMPEASLGCFTIGDEVSQVALLMCNGKDAETASPVEKDGVAYEWVKGVITNEGPEAICQLNFASADLQLAKIPELETLPADLSELTSFKLEPQQKMDYAFLLPVDAEKGVPTIGIMDSLGPCGMIEKAKEALAAIPAGASDTMATAKGVAEDAAALGKKSFEEAAAAAAAAKATGQGAVDVTKAAAGNAADATKAAAGDVAGATKAAAEEAADATKAAAEDAVDATVNAGEDTTAAVTEAVAEVPKVTQVGDIAKLDGEGVPAIKAEGEVTSPAPKMSASVMGLFTVAVLVAVQLLL